MNTPAPPTKTSRDFERVITWSAAFSMAVFAGFLAALEQIEPTLKFRFSALVILAFFGTGLVTAIVFRTIFRLNRSDEGGSRQGPRIRWHWLMVFLLASGTALASFILVTIRYVPAGHRADLLIGESVAIIVVSGGGWLIWRLIHFLESQDDENPPPENHRPGE